MKALLIVSLILYTSRCPTKHNYPVMFRSESVVVYFGTATKRRSRGVLWSIVAPPFISTTTLLRTPGSELNGTIAPTVPADVKRTGAAGLLNGTRVPVSCVRYLPPSGDATARVSGPSPVPKMVTICSGASASAVKSAEFNTVPRRNDGPFGEGEMRSGVN
jgi:hypothetical protein